METGFKHDLTHRRYACTKFTELPDSMLADDFAESVSSTTININTKKDSFRKNRMAIMFVYFFILIII